VGALANIKPPEEAEPGHPTVRGGGSSYWAVALAVCIAIAAVGAAGIFEFWQRRRQGSNLSGN
jgi:hypothetical protein